MKTTRELAVNHYQSILNNPKQGFQPSQCTGILERDSLYKSAYYEKFKAVLAKYPNLLDMPPKNILELMKSPITKEYECYLLDIAAIHLHDKLVDIERTKAELIKYKSSDLYEKDKQSELETKMSLHLK